MSLARWERFRALRKAGVSMERALNPQRKRFFEVDPERARIYKELLRLGYDEESSRKWSKENYRHEGLKRIEEGRKKGSGFDILLPPEIRDEQDLDVKIKMAVGLLGPWRMVSLGEKRSSLEAGLFIAAKEAINLGEDPNAAIQNQLNLWRVQSRQKRQELPIEGTIVTPRGEVTREIAAPERAALPPSAEEQEEFLGMIEQFADDNVRRAKPDLDESSISIIVKKAVSAARAALESGESQFAVAHLAEQTVRDAIAKASGTEVRADNPSMFVLEAHDTKFWPFKKMSGNVDFVQFMAVASKVAQGMGKPRPRTKKDAVGLLDRAGYKVMETV